MGGPATRRPESGWGRKQSEVQAERWYERSQSFLLHHLSSSPNHARFRRVAFNWGSGPAGDSFVLKIPRRAVARTACISCRLVRPRGVTHWAAGAGASRPIDHLKLGKGVRA